MSHYSTYQQISRTQTIQLSYFRVFYTTLWKTCHRKHHVWILSHRNYLNTFDIWASSLRTCEQGWNLASVAYMHHKKLSLPYDAYVHLNSIYLLRTPEGDKKMCTISVNKHISSQNSVAVLNTYCPQLEGKHANKFVSWSHFDNIYERNHQSESNRYNDIAKYTIHP